MNDGALTGLIQGVVTVAIIAGLIRRMFRGATRRGRPGPARASAPATVPAPAASARPVRRRLSETPAVPVVAPARARPAIAPSMGDMLSHEAAAAFPTLDLSLGDDAAPGTAAARPRRPRGIAGGAPIGSRGWGVNAIVAAEVLGTPVGLRAGATVGVPHAF